MESVTFEDAYARLEAAVNALQDGQMPLERGIVFAKDIVVNHDHGRAMLFSEILQFSFRHND